MGPHNFITLEAPKSHNPVLIKGIRVHYAVQHEIRIFIAFSYELYNLYFAYLRYLFLLEDVTSLVDVT